MSTKYQMQIAKDLSQKKIVISRDFDTDLQALWKAYTDSSILDQWWAPRPWKAATKSMDFQEGGHWLYAMVSPEGEKHWGKVLYGKIVPLASFIADDMFCDEQGKPNTGMPRMPMSLS